MVRSTLFSLPSALLVVAGVMFGATQSAPAQAQDMQVMRAQTGAVNRAVANQVHHAMRLKPAVPVAAVAGVGADSEEVAAAARATSSARRMRAGGSADR
ncbi:exported hypothetical protein [uncultured Gammaproteobacteria bacterium]